MILDDGMTRGGTGREVLKSCTILCAYRIIPTALMSSFLQGDAVNAILDCSAMNYAAGQMKLLVVFT